jgi:hypothetical protein
MERKDNLSLRNIAKLITIGGALGVVLAIVGHYSPVVLSASGPVGALIALVFSSLFGFFYAESYSQSAQGGALTGFGCAFIGILFGFILGDQPVVVLIGGSIGGAVAGTIGGLISCTLARRRSAVL